MRLILAPLLLGLVACDREPPAAVQAGEQQQQADAPVRDVEAIPADETAAAAVGEGDGAPAVESGTISAALHGRWGLTPADCDPARADNKGLMTVAEDTLRFYESRARLQTVASVAPDRIDARFAFTGEGQEWSADVTLTRQGDTLTREQDGEPLAYKRCT